MPKRVFISFQMEDEFARNLLIQQAKDERNDLQFIDYSVKDPWDNAWKSECAKRIGQTTGTIVFVGRTTYQSEAVKWEIEESFRQEHPVFGIWVYREERPPFPSGLSHTQMLPWDLDRIAEELDAWS